MKKIFNVFIALILCASIFLGGAAYASSGSKKIEIFYDNIKVYKDNVLCELKDSDGNVIEPFIYNGTTYMPVRGTATLADMQVTWDGATKSVYLWDEKVPDGTYLVDVCPPYALDWCDIHKSSDGSNFSMAGKKYSDGLTFYTDIFGRSTGYALFNLDSKYSTLQCTIGHTKYNNVDKTVSFLVDGRVVETVELEAECLPKQVSIPITYGLQLKILVNGEGSYIGIADMTVS